MKVTVKAPGSCGELVQGNIAGNNFLITCPIDLYSEVTITNEQGSANIGHKALIAIEKTLQYLQLAKTDFKVTVKSELPAGKGMASSSADISAACQAIALANKKVLTPDEIANIALAIEPTDGVFYPGVVLFDHVKGLMRKKLGMPPAAYIAVFDIGGEIDTVLFNKRNDLEKLNREKEKLVIDAINSVIQGLTAGDIKLIGKGATISALANQKILYKASLEEIIEISLSCKAAGVNIAHSGTVVGVLFAPNELDACYQCIDKINKYCHGKVEFLQVVRFISGGLLKIEGDSNEWSKCF